MENLRAQGTRVPALTPLIMHARARRAPVKVLVASNEFSKECRMRANYSDLHQFRMKSNPRISKGLISESKFGFETAGSIRSSTLILKHAFDKVKGMQQARKLPKPLVKL